MEKIDQILDSLYDRVIEPMEAKEQLLDLFISIALENKRKAFCIWYYAQSQPLDANKVFDWFSNEC